MAFLTRDQVKSAIDGRQEGMTPENVLDALLSQGYSLEGYNPKLKLGKANKPKNQTMLGRAWEALAVPEQLSRQGLTQIAEAIPSYEPKGNMAMDIAANIPRVMAETLAEGAPQFISRGSILTAGLLRGAKAAAPAARAVGRYIGKAAEAVSGLEYKTPGVLRAAVKEPSLIFGPSTAKAGEKYIAVLDPTKVRPIFAQSMSHKELLDVANQAAREGTLTAEEALIARQTLDAAKKKIPRYAYQEMRKVFDKVAKTLTKEADIDFARAVKSEALRQPFPVNKLGGTSKAQLILGSAAGAMPLMLGSGTAGVFPLLAASAMSPAVQGSIASGIGLGARAISPFVNNPYLTGRLSGPLLNLLFSNRQNDQ